MGGSVATGMDGNFSADMLDWPATASSVTYGMVGGGSACSSIGTQLIKLDEIMGALDVPANDNGDALRLVG